MSGGLLYLDRAGGPDRRALEELRTRTAAFLSAEPGEVLLAATPESFALVGLDPARAQVIGPSGQPVAVLVLPDITDMARRLETTLTDAAIEAALLALDPVSQAAMASKAQAIAAALEAAAVSFETWPDVISADVIPPTLLLTSDNGDALRQRLTASGLVLRELGDGRFEARCASIQQAAALRDQLGAPGPRRADIRRTTKETDISVSVDLDREGPIAARTGLAFFDHMLDQVARHGGFALDVTAQGDLDVDAHHTIEDVCLALGEAIRAALGDKRGLARFGFELPMDETRAGVWIDLSGRPFCKFDGDIPGERVAGFPVEMCAHAFRSLAEAMKASIHVSVTGENAHHMIEACFKAFGRAMRQAIRVEGRAIPSTKGVI